MRKKFTKTAASLFLAISLLFAITAGTVANATGTDFLSFSNTLSIQGEEYLNFSFSENDYYLNKTKVASDSVIQFWSNFQSNNQLESIEVRLTNGNYHLERIKLGTISSEYDCSAAELTQKDPESLLFYVASTLSLNENHSIALDIYNDDRNYNVDDTIIGSVVFTAVDGMVQEINLGYSRNGAKTGGDIELEDPAYEGTIVETIPFGAKVSVSAFSGTKVFKVVSSSAKTMGIGVTFHNIDFDITDDNGNVIGGGGDLFRPNYYIFDANGNEATSIGAWTPEGYMVTDYEVTPGEPYYVIVSSFEYDYGLMTRTGYMEDDDPDDNVQLNLWQRIIEWIKKILGIFGIMFG